MLSSSSSSTTRRVPSQLISRSVLLLKTARATASSSCYSFPSLTVSGGAALDRRELPRSSAAATTTGAAAAVARAAQRSFDGNRSGAIPNSDPVPSEILATGWYCKRGIFLQGQSHFLQQQKQQQPSVRFFSSTTETTTTTADDVGDSDDTDEKMKSSDGDGGGGSGSGGDGDSGSSSISSSYAFVDHSAAYHSALRGRHGQQLALAELEGVGKDDPPFDPFIEEEMLEDAENERLRRLEEHEQRRGNRDTDEEEDGEYDDDEYDDDEDEEDDDENEGEYDEEDIKFKAVYNRDGSLKRSKSELATFRAGAPAGGLFAIIEMAGTQFKVTTDDALIVNRLRPVDKWKVGSIHTLAGEDCVLMISCSDYTVVGTPRVAGGAAVTVQVEEITKDKKVIVFKKRRRKNSKRKNGFRRDVTILRILDILPPAKYRSREYVKRAPPALPEEDETAAAAERAA